MPPYTRSQPVASDKLSVSQPILKDNTDASDDSFNVDHYGFSTLTANNGLHKQVTSVVQASVPTTAANPMLYAYQQYANVGALQYSKGPSDPVPSPITTKQSSSTPITIGVSPANVPLLDFTGINYCIFTVYASGQSASGSFKILYAVGSRVNGTFILNNLISTDLAIQSSGNNLLLANTSGSNAMNLVSWVLEYKRII